MYRNLTPLAIENPNSNSDGPCRLILGVSLGGLLRQDMAPSAVGDAGQERHLRSVGAFLDQLLVKEGLWQELEHHESEDSLGQCLYFPKPKTKQQEEKCV